MSNPPQKITPRAARLVKTFLADPSGERLVTDKFIHDPHVRALIETARNRPLGSVVHNYCDCAGLICLDGVRTLEYFEGSLDAFMSEISRSFPVDAPLSVQICVPHDDPALPQHEVEMIIGKYWFCDRSGKRTRPLFQLLLEQKNP